MPGDPSSFLFLEAMPGAPSNGPFELFEALGDSGEAQELAGHSSATRKDVPVYK